MESNLVIQVLCCWLAAKELYTCDSDFTDGYGNVNS